MAAAVAAASRSPAMAKVAAVMSVAGGAAAPGRPPLMHDEAAPDSPAVLAMKLRMAAMQAQLEDRNEELSRLRRENEELRQHSPALSAQSSNCAPSPLTTPLTTPIATPLLTPMATPSLQGESETVGVAQLPPLQLQEDSATVDTTCE